MPVESLKTISEEVFEATTSDWDTQLLEGTFIKDTKVEEMLAAERRRVWAMVKHISGPRDGMTANELKEAFNTNSWETILDAGVDIVLKLYEKWKKAENDYKRVQAIRPQDVIRVEFGEDTQIGMVTKKYIRPDGGIEFTYIKSDGDWGYTSKSMKQLHQITLLGRIVETQDILGDIKTYENRYRDEEENK